VANVKGITILNAVKTLRLKKAESRALLPMDLHRYLEDRILVSSWYPEEDLLGLLRVLGKILPDPGIDIFEFMGLASARTDLSGVYSHMLRLGDPVGTLRHGSVLWRSHHDTGKLEVVVSSPERAVVQLSGFGFPSNEICRTIKGWIRELIRMAGGKDVSVADDQCVVRGDTACRFDAKWTAAAGGDSEA